MLPNIDELVNVFNSTCSGILDSVAQLKPKPAKLSHQPWLNKTTPALRWECSRAEKRTNQASLGILRDYLSIRGL